MKNWFVKINLATGIKFLLAQRKYYLLLARPLETCKWVNKLGIEFSTFSIGPMCHLEHILPPIPGETGPEAERQQIQYEHWLNKHGEFLEMQMKFLEQQIQKQKRTKKAINARNRQVHSTQSLRKLFHFFDQILWYDHHWNRLQWVVIPYGWLTNEKYFFRVNSFISWPNTMVWPPLESPQKDDSNECTHHMVWLTNDFVLFLSW